MGSKSTIGLEFSRGRTFSTAALLAATIAALPGEAFGQQAYFSLEGDFPVAGDQQDFTFNLANDQASTPGMFFRTYSGSGGTNLAGDTVANGPIDPVLELFDAGNALIGHDDDSFSLDSQIDFSGTTDTPIPQPLPAGDYRLNHRTFGNSDAGPWALDLAGPAGNLTLTGTSPVNSSTVTSLKLGTIDTGMGTDAATFNHGGNLTLTGALVVAQTGSAVLTNTGTLSVGGTTTVNTGGTLDTTAGTFNPSDDVIVAGGTLERGLATATYNTDLIIDNGGTVQGGLTFFAQGPGTTGTFDIGAGSSLTAGAGGLRVGENGFAVGRVISGGTLTSANATIGTFAGADGRITVDGLGSTWTNNGPLFVGGSFTDPGGTGLLRVMNNGTVTSSGDLKIYGPGTVTVDATSTLDANGNITVEGGTLTIERTNFNILASGQTFRATNEAQIDTDATGTGLFIDDNRTYEVLSGSDWTHANQLSVGAVNGTGTLTVEGSGTTLTKDNAFALAVAQFGSTGTFNLRDGALADIDSGLFVANSFNQAGANGTVNVESGADMNVRNILIGSNDGDQGMGTLNLTGTGSTITQTGNAVLTLGNADTPGNGGVHTVNIADAAAFTTGTGTTTVNATGTLNIESTVVSGQFGTGSRLTLNGDLNIEAGALVTSDAGQIVAGTTPGATLTNRGTFRPRSVGDGDTRSGPLVAVPYVQEAGGTFEIGPTAGNGSFIPSLTTLFQNADYTLAGELRLIADRTGDPLTDLGFLTPYGFGGELIASFAGSPARTGVFDTVTGHILGDGTALAILYDGADVNAQRVLFGDGNLDGFISQADLDAVLLNWGKGNLNGNNDGVSWITGDYSGDGFVSQADLDAVLLNWGSGTPPSPLTAIPEPASLIFLVLGGAGVLLRRRP